MHAADWQQLSALFDTLADLPAAERDARLAALQPPELAARLARMLAGLPADPEATAPPQPGFDAQLARALAEPPAAPAPQPGDRFGAWALVHLLGEGGMGAVWLAERADGLYQGQAAIKLLREDIAGPGLAARFARERALLGRLTHPGIARLLDAGEQDGRAFLVLEHVAGQTLSEHVRQRALPLAARVRLLVEVARAVEHAHAHLVVHRDLKPSNVMLDEAGTTKLLDFGIAGLLDDRGLQADSQLTQLAGRRLTPAYAAPEQITGGAIGVAVDVYSLGVMLYELASGQLPFGGHGASRTQVEHAVLHTEAQRLSRSSGDAAATPDTGPGRPPDAHRARGDLEAVAAKALRKDPAERYPSVGALVDDLQRWLEQRPVGVRAEDWRHRLHLWTRRNAALAAGGLLVFAALSAGLGVSLWQRHEAQAAARQSELVTAYLGELLSAASPDQNGGRQPTVVELLDRKRQELATRFNDQPEVKDRIFDTLIRTYFTLQRFDVAAPLAEERLAHARRAFGADDPRTDEAAETLAGIHTAVAGAQPVIDLLAPVLVRYDRRHGPLSEESHTLRLHLLTAYGRVGRFDDAERELAQARKSNDVINADNAFQHARLATYASVLRVQQGRLTEAEALLEGTRRFWDDQTPENMRNSLVLQRNLAFTRWRLAREDAATATATSDALMRRWDALTGRPGNHASTLMRQQLAAYLLLLGEFGPAREQLERAQAETEAAGADDAVTGQLRRNALLQARVLAAGGATAADIAAAGDALQRLDAAPLIGDVRRAEGLLLLGHVALAPGGGAPGRALGRQIGQRLEALAGPLHLARNLTTRIALFQARLAGGTAPWLAATAQRAAYFDALPEPQGLPDWIARLQQACALRAAGRDAGAALAAAERVRPARLEQLTPRPHPLSLAARALAAGQAPAPDCDWRF